MPIWPFARRRPARRVPAPPAPLVFDGTFVWESPTYRQRRRDRVEDAQRDVDAMVAERTGHHPRARAAYDGRIAGLTADWHLEDDDEHAKSLGRLRRMQTETEVARKGSQAQLEKAQEAQRLAWHDWREGYLRLGGELPEEPVEPSEPEPGISGDSSVRPAPPAIEPPPRERRPTGDGRAEDLPERSPRRGAEDDGDDERWSEENR